MLPKYVKFPVADKLKETVKGFLDKWGIPQCAGSIDGSHIPVLPPTMNHTDYYNRKGFYSVNVQAVVDHNLLFTDLYIGWPGSVHDARVLVNSALYSRCSSKEWLKGDTVRVGNSQLPTFLIGDSASLFHGYLSHFPCLQHCLVHKRLTTIGYAEEELLLNWHLDA